MLGTVVHHTVYPVEEVAGWGVFPIEGLGSSLKQKAQKKKTLNALKPVMVKPQAKNFENTVLYFVTTT